MAPWKFNDAVSGANADWRAACREEDLAEELARKSQEPDGLFTYDEVRSQSPEEEAAEIERKLEAEWISQIGDNLRQLVAKESSIPLLGKINDIYGPTLGQAREKHLRAAWDALVKAGFIKPRNTKIKIYKDTLTGRHG
ncbi:hypothetical protein [Candidatus Protofrankia datiscae]|uniref:hypothetical protein n=1 Tax=Candidatus Protofrankia datiscae TaxID=2716812 RepID=UPI0001C530FD|nr:hypothetical protein [Candidatus Protofrankia datiscae]